MLIIFHRRSSALQDHKVRNLLTVQGAAVSTQIRDQMSDPDLHVFTLKFLALKKTGFSPIKNTFQIFQT